MKGTKTVKTENDMGLCTKKESFRQLSIGPVQLANPVVAAPMAGITDKPCRLLAREAGCGLVITEMISAQALIFNSSRTKAMLDIEGESPVSVQLFGCEPELLAEAARLVEEGGADIIDINMGCPTPKIVKNGEGSALMRNLPLAGSIIKAVARAVRVPITVKMRKGWDENSVNAVELARIAEDAGAAAVAVHGRTRSQFYSGQADWSIIARVKEALEIPVIGNGDIWSPEDAAGMLAFTGCDGVMVGRGALGNPWLFRRVIAFLEKGEKAPLPGPEEKIKMALRHLGMTVERLGEYRGIRVMRKHLAWYLKGLPEAARVREKINHLTSLAEIKNLLNAYIQETAGKS